MRRLRVTDLLCVSLVALGLVAACSSDAGPAASDNGSSTSGSIAGTSTSGFVNSSGGASGKGSASGGSTSGLQGTDLVDTTEESMDFNGATRTYLFSKPKTIDASRKYPLVISFHGNPGSPKVQHDTLPFDSASKDQAFVAYPLAADGSDWNLNLPGDGNADMDFVKALITELASKQPIDPAKVLGFGYSGGGYFLSQYACRVSGVLKMVAIVAGGAPEFHDGDQKRTDDCVICPAGPIPIFIAHGMNDTSDSPFEGGDFARICWAEQNGCTNSSLHQVSGTCSTYNGCNDGKPVEWCPVPNLDHTAWTGSIQAAWTMFSGL